MKIIYAIIITVVVFFQNTFGLLPIGGSYQVLYQGDVYYHYGSAPPGINIPATLEKDAPALIYIGKISSISKKYATPSEELQGNYFSQWRAEVYLHEDGYLYLFPVRGNAYTLVSSYDVLPDAP